MKRGKETRAKYLEKNKEKIAKQKRENYILNKEKRLKYNKEYGKINKEKIRNYQKNKLENNPLFKLKTNIKNLVGDSIRKRGFKKFSRTELILGCSYEEFKNHIESKFESWMNWNNHGNPKDGILELSKTWDIDHKIPLSSAKNEEELLKLNHYTNLQPLCSYTNRYIKRNL